MQVCELPSAVQQYHLTLWYLLLCPLLYTLVQHCYLLHYLIIDFIGHVHHHIICCCVVNCVLLSIMIIIFFIIIGCISVVSSIINMLSIPLQCYHFLLHPFWLYPL